MTRRARSCPGHARVAYGGAVRDVPWWGLASAAAAPVLLVGGWTAAADLQPRFDEVADTVSSLAAPGATDRWVMTLTFLAVGVCYILTGLALRPAGQVVRPARPIAAQIMWGAGYGVPVCTGLAATSMPAADPATRISRPATPAGRSARPVRM